jgi:hypothetical protein
MEAPAIYAGAQPGFGGVQPDLVVYEQCVSELERA